jgi:hypothetical protein
MAAKLTRLTHKIVVQLHLVAESYTIRSSRAKATSPETFGYTVVRIGTLCLPCAVNWFLDGVRARKVRSKIHTQFFFGSLILLDI